MRVAAPGIVIGVGLIVGIVLWARHDRDQAYETGEGELADATMVDSVLVTLAFQRFVDIDDEPGTRWRATAYDAKTGARIARAFEVEWRRCAGDGPGRMWCLREQGGVERVRVPSLEVEPTNPSERTQGARTIMDRPVSSQGQRVFPGSDRFSKARQLEATTNRAVIAVGSELQIFAREADGLAASPLAVHPAAFGGGQRWLIDESLLVLLLPPLHSTVAIDLQTGRERWRVRH